MEQKQTQYVTALDIARARGAKRDGETFSMEAVEAVGIPFFGGCRSCMASLSCGNGYPSRIGFWLCGDCLGDQGFTSVEEFEAFIQPTSPQNGAWCVPTGRGLKEHAMKNRAMGRLLDQGKAVDVNLVGEQVLPSLYHLTKIPAKVIEDGELDFCDAQKEAWIWSIGEELKTGKIYAATDTRFYMNSRFRCIWLR